MLCCATSTWQVTVNSELPVLRQRTVGRIITGFGLSIVVHAISALRPPRFWKVIIPGLCESTENSCAWNTEITERRTASEEVVRIVVEARLSTPPPPTPTAAPQPDNTRHPSPESHDLRFMSPRCLARFSRRAPSPKSPTMPEHNDRPRSFTR